MRSEKPTRVRRRVPAAERREELISAAVHEFAKGGLRGTAVDRIARRVGVAQPYVFSLFPSKRELFIAALERSFERISETFRFAAAEYHEGLAPEDCEDTLQAMGLAYRKLLESDRDYLMLQHQCYAACDDEVVRARVRHRFAQLVELARELSGARARAPGRVLHARHGAQRRGGAGRGGIVRAVPVVGRRARGGAGRLGLSRKE